MGILPEAEVRLVKGGVGGPVIVEVRGTRLILGRALAHRVMVEPVA
jgi:ferrous iron transport protein A